MPDIILAPVWRMLSNRFLGLTSLTLSLMPTAAFLAYLDSSACFISIVRPSLLPIERTSVMASMRWSSLILT